LYSAGRHSGKIQNKYLEFNTSKSMSCWGHKSKFKKGTGTIPVHINAINFAFAI
jgi:hypothetical protein